MPLIGGRDDWEELVRRNDEGVGLNRAHIGVIRNALATARGDMVVVRAGVSAEVLATRKRAMDDHVAIHFDGEELWWRQRAKQLGLTSIRLVDWPRLPEARAATDAMRGHHWWETLQEDQPDAGEAQE